jgi:aarF domain-containing kinase
LKDPERQAAVPVGRVRRSLHLARLAGEVAASTVAAGVGMLARGERPTLPGTLLTPGNAQRLVERLSQMRGAVMKVGQLMSMDGDGVLPAHFSQLLSALRNQAHTMPATQLAEVLEQAYGASWHTRFRRFSFAPVAAASIGQVHRAETHDGQVLALKIQYPGVRSSIDSDVANLALLLKTPGLVPHGVDLTEVLNKVREQLHAEADYEAEAKHATEYRLRLGDHPDFTVPQVHAEHSTPQILAMDFIEGQPLDALMKPGAGQAQKDHVARALCQLAVHEFFQMRLVQTDPNFANYLFDANTGRIALLDFGATEVVSATRVEQLRELARALRNADRSRATAAAMATGVISPADSSAQVRGIMDLLMLIGQPLQAEGVYDFGGSGLIAQAFQQGQAQILGEGYGSPPPADLLFLQRKFAGTFMLCNRLGAKLDLREVFGAEL